MTWKKVNNSDPGDATHFGGNDIDKISDLFSGVADVDTVDLNSETKFRHQKFKVRNPANTFSYIMNTSAIGANRNVTLPLLTADDTFVFATFAQTISNKIFTGYNFDSVTNVFKGFAQDPLGRRWGCYQPTGSGTTNATVGTLEGMLTPHTATGAGTPSNIWDTTEGLYSNHVSGTTSGNIAGLASPANAPGLLKITAGSMMRVRCKVDTTTSSRLYFGVSSASTLPTSDTPLATTDKGVIVGFTTADSNFTARGNDGSGTAGSYSMGVAKNNSWNTFEISWIGSGLVGPVQISLNGTLATTISSSADLPGDLDTMFFHLQVQTATAASRTISLKSVWVESA